MSEALIELMQRMERDLHAALAAHCADESVHGSGEDHVHPHAHQAGEEIAEALHALAVAEAAAASEAETPEVAEVQAEAAVVAEEAAQEIELEEAAMPEPEEAPARIHPLHYRIGGAA
jgi:hypothetical protein